MCKTALWYFLATHASSRMSTQSRSQVVQSKPIGEGLNGFRKTFKSTCKNVGIPTSSQALKQVGYEGSTGWHRFCTSDAYTETQDLFVIFFPFCKPFQRLDFYGPSIKAKPPLITSCGLMLQSARITLTSNEYGLCSMRSSNFSPMKSS